MEVSKKIVFIKDWILNYVNSMPKKAQSLIIGILKTIVFMPVIAHKVLVTDESIPPDIPITND